MYYCLWLNTANLRSDFNAFSDEINYIWRQSFSIFVQNWQELEVKNKNGMAKTFVCWNMKSLTERHLWVNIIECNTTIIVKTWTGVGFSRRCKWKVKKDTGFKFLMPGQLKLKLLTNKQTNLCKFWISNYVK